MAMKKKAATNRSSRSGKAAKSAVKKSVAKAPKEPAKRAGKATPKKSATKAVPKKKAAKGTFVKSAVVKVRERTAAPVAERADQLPTKTMNEPVQRNVRKPSSRKTRSRNERKAAAERSPAAGHVMGAPEEEQNQEERSAGTRARSHKKPKSFLRQGQAKPNELHRGQTAEHGATHDRPGSQPERVRHLYPNGNKPNSGSGRSTQYKGKRLDNGSRMDG